MTTKSRTNSMQISDFHLSELFQDMSVERIISNCELLLNYHDYIVPKLPQIMKIKSTIFPVVSNSNAILGYANKATIHNHLKNILKPSLVNSQFTPYKFKIAAVMERQFMLSSSKALAKNVLHYMLQNEIEVCFVTDLNNSLLGQVIIHEFIDLDARLEY